MKFNCLFVRALSIQLVNYNFRLFCPPLLWFCISLSNFAFFRPESPRRKNHVSQQVSKGAYGNDQRPAIAPFVFVRGCGAIPAIVRFHHPYFLQLLNLIVLDGTVHSKSCKNAALLDRHFRGSNGGRSVGQWSGYYNS